ncbi:MAG: plasmid pRiA4b ORF-3 family protein [Flavobacteriaceae bacterium]|jgi:hypothetical protein|nr:plasmid pRiA4b ORF-3 family protein [Flavobacteriaceae bacterium]
MVYKIRVVLDTKENIFRDIEIKDSQTLWNLHLGIKSAFSLQGDELSAFNIPDDEGVILKTVSLEDMSDEGDGEIMSDIYLNEVFQEIGDKGHFQYGLLDLWEFFCELIEISEEKPSVNYPITVYRFGNVPLKAPGRSSDFSKKTSMPLMDDDFHDEFSELSSEHFDDDANHFDDEEDNYTDDFYEGDEE